MRLINALLKQWKLNELNRKQKKKKQNETFENWIEDLDLFVFLILPTSFCIWNKTHTNYSEAAVSSFPYCTESSLNFSTSATAYSEDDAEYATGRRNKTSRVNITILERTIFATKSQKTLTSTHDSFDWFERSINRIQNQRIKSVSAE